MEGKIVAAVFTTLAVVFAGVSGSSINSDVDEVLPEEDSPINDFTSSFEILDRIFALPEPETEAEVVVNLSEPHDINLNSESLEVEGLRTLEGSTGITSETDIGLRDYNGNIVMGNETELIGSASGFYTDDLEVNSTAPVNQEVETDYILAGNVSNSAFDLQASNVRVEALEGDTSISRSSTSVEITAFEGDIEFYPAENRMVLTGKVDEVNAGTASFSGQDD